MNWDQLLCHLGLALATGSAAVLCNSVRRTSSRWRYRWEALALMLLNGGLCAYSLGKITLQIVRAWRC